MPWWSGPNLNREIGCREYTDLDSGFNALLRSVMRSSTMGPLLDHKAEIVYRTVERVVSLPKKGTQSPYRYD